MTLPFGRGIVFEYPRFIASNDSPEQVWIVLEALDNVLTDSDSLLFLVLGQQIGNHFVHTLHISRFSVMILQTVSLLMESSSAIIRTMSRRSTHTSCFTRSMLFAVLLVEGLPDRGSSSTSSCPSLNLLCHSNARVRDIVSSPYTCCSIVKDSEGVLPSLARNFRLALRSRLSATTQTRQHVKHDL